MNSKSGIVQIKMNRGPNHILKGDEAKKFESRRNEHFPLRVDDESVANLMAANDYIEGRI